MRYIDEFRDKDLIRILAARIKNIAPAQEIKIMEVCGTHTQSFFRFGLGKLLPDNLRLISGPGCPVCVSHQDYIDKAIALAGDTRNIIVTFGDMLRVPGTLSTLEKERAKGAQVRVIYSPLDALIVAGKNPGKKIIFLGVGFETTIPTVALTILAAQKEKLGNIFFFSSFKLIIPAMKHLLGDRRLGLAGFLCPGHVSAIIGTKPYAFIPKKHGIGCCVAGFEPVDILEGIYLLVRQIAARKPALTNQYARVVKPQGNLRAQKIISRLFQPSDVLWRGLGNIPKSGLKLRGKFSRFDAENAFNITPNTQHPCLAGRQATSNTKCKCGEVLKGLMRPLDCPLFSKVCNPDNPYGPCMVSSEGACNAYYRYR